MASLNSRPWAGEAGRRALLLAGGLAVSALVALWLPSLLHALLHYTGYAVCHQIPEHSFFIGGRQLPLCARCTGTFLGATIALGAIVWRGRTRAANLPPTPLLAVLVLFIAAWVGDGVNSYLDLMGWPHLYAPHNWLRLATGFLNGMAVTSVAMPVFHLTVWRATTAEPSLRGWRELASLLLAALVAGALIVWGPAFLFGPVALWSIFGVVALLTVVNAVIVVVLLGRDGKGESWRDLALPLGLAFLLSAAEIAAIDLGRAWLTATLALPF